MINEEGYKRDHCPVSTMPESVNNIQSKNGQKIEDKIDNNIQDHLSPSDALWA